MDESKKQQIKKDIQGVIDYAFDDKSDQERIQVGKFLVEQGFSDVFVSTIILLRNQLFKNES